MTGRTFKVKLLTITFLIVFIAGMQRFVSAIQNFSFLEGLLFFSPYYLVISGLLWGVTGLLIIFQVWFNQPYQRPITLIGTLFVTLSYWIERLAFYKNSAAQANLFFSITFTLLMLIFISAILYSPRSAQFYPRRKQHEK